MQQIKITKIFICLSFCFICFATYHDVKADELHNDYKQLILKRQDLEKRQSDYESQIRISGSRLNTIASELSLCAYDKKNRMVKRDLWEEQLKKAEEFKKTKEDERQALLLLLKGIYETRQTLEKNRIEIEQKYKNKRRGAGYEAEFRQYMKILAEQYFKRIENELLGEYENYLKKSDEYFIFLENTLDLCRKNDSSLFVQEYKADALQDDYREIEEKRNNIETKRIEYENRLERLTAQISRAASDLNQCLKHADYGTLKYAVWEYRIRDAEDARKTKEDERQNLNKLREELRAVRYQFENIRIGIEQKYKDKDPGSEYETEFRQYMKNLEEQYFNRIEKELFSGYDGYLAWSEAYLTFLRDSADLCRKSIEAR